jgi:membrane protease YdiL (CAAX protease family)
MSHPEDVTEEIRLNNSKRVPALIKFLAFAAAIALLLVAINATLRRIPATASLLELAQAGTITASLLVVLDGISLLAVFLVCRFIAGVERQSFSDYGLPLGQAFQKRFWQGFTWGLSLAFLDIAITYVLGGFSFGPLALSARDIVIYTLAWSIAFIVVALFEEFLFRGYALYSLGIGLGFWPASILLSALFAGLHLMNSGESTIGALDVMIYSLFACFALRRTGTLWFAVGLHAAWDFSLTFIYSVPGSGMHATGQLLRSSLRGPTWLTGGSAGPEGSAVGLAVLIVSFCFFPKLFQESRNNGDRRFPLPGISNK